MEASEAYTSAGAALALRSCGRRPGGAPLPPARIADPSVGALRLIVSMDLALPSSDVGHPRVHRVVGLLNLKMDRQSASAFNGRGPIGDAERPPAIGHGMGSGYLATMFPDARYVGNSGRKGRAGVRVGGNQINDAAAKHLDGLRRLRVLRMHGAATEQRGDAVKIGVQSDTQEAPKCPRPFDNSITEGNHS